MKKLALFVVAAIFAGSTFANTIGVAKTHTKSVQEKTVAPTEKKEKSAPKEKKECGKKGNKTCKDKKE